MPLENKISWYHSPPGTLKIISNTENVTGLYFSDEVCETTDTVGNQLLNQLHLQLDAYFTGGLTNFDLPISPEGTSFQKSVWEMLQQIPFGRTWSYMDLARQMGNVKKIRAVANANAKNPISIIIPCHRVIGSDGNLTGYAGGLHRKKWLLEHEQKSKQPGLFDDD